MRGKNTEYWKDRAEMMTAPLKSFFEFRRQYWGEDYHPEEIRDFLNMENYNLVYFTVLLLMNELEDRATKAVAFLGNNGNGKGLSPFPNSQKLREYMEKHNEKRAFLEARGFNKSYIDMLYGVFLSIDTAVLSISAEWARIVRDIASSIYLAVSSGQRSVLEYSREELFDLYPAGVRIEEILPPQAIQQFQYIVQTALDIEPVGGKK